MSKPDLTIGMAVHDDLDGVYFSVQAINLYHPEISDRIEIVVLDNNPDSPDGADVKDYIEWVPNARYEPYADWKSTAVRDKLFDFAKSDYVLCMDSHIMFFPGSLLRLIQFYEQNVHCGDLLQGPLVYDDLKAYSSHFDHIWRDGMLGIWGTDDRAADPNSDPFEIPMQGLGCFACRKDGWLGFNRLFRGFGGEEWYIHEKFRQAGKKTLCLPFLRWAHRFRRPQGVNYHLSQESRISNYYVGHLELGADVTAITNHFEDIVGREECDKIYGAAKRDLMMQPLYIRNSAPEIPIVSCVILVNEYSSGINEAVEAFNRQLYQARELIIFNTSANEIHYCDHVAKVINYPDQPESIAHCIRLATEACNGDFIAIWECNNLEMPWSLSVAMEHLNAGFDCWKPNSYWIYDNNHLRISSASHDPVLNCVVRRGLIDRLSDLPGVDPEVSKLSTVVRVPVPEPVEPYVNIVPLWHKNYARLVSVAGAGALNEIESTQKIPIYLTICDILSWAEDAIVELERFADVEIILVDNCSLAPEMIYFLNMTPYEVIKLPTRLPRNDISSSGIQAMSDGVFMVADSFFDFSDLPGDTIEALRDLMLDTGSTRCGVSVECGDLPDRNPCKASIVSIERDHWAKPVGSYFDTSAGRAFVMGNSDRLSESVDGWHTKQFRLGKPHIVRYRPWYLDFDDLDEEVKGYLKNVSPDLFSEFEGHVAEV